MKKAYGVSTSQIIREYEKVENVVTKSVYREILGNRIDRMELFRLSALERLKKVEEKLNIMQDN